MVVVLEDPRLEVVVVYGPGTPGVSDVGEGRGGDAGGGGAVQLAQPCHITTVTKLLVSFEDAGIIGRTKEGS